MKRSSCAALLALIATGCAAMPTLMERPESYALYRTARIAPTLEERLGAAQRYLREEPRGPHAEQLRVWFLGAEEQYFLRAFDRLPHLYAYRAALPTGPHIEDVRTRISVLEKRKTRRTERDIEEDARIAATQAHLAEADAQRRAFVATFKDWTLRLSKIDSFGKPTSELSQDTVRALGTGDPRGPCQGDRCRKLIEVRYEVPGERELVERAALLEVELVLERGLLRLARISGPELWTRLAEALSVRALPSPTPEQRADALNRAALLVRALLEPALPAVECDLAPAPPLVLSRQCRGLRVRMLAGATPTDDDSLEIAPSTP